MQEFLEELKRLASTPITVPRNPRVAAIIVDQNDKIIATGIHTGKGNDHAEVAALKKSSGDLSDCTMYVSLEPCNHHGATGPCTEAIIQSGIKKLVIGSLDPNPESTGGLKRLRDAGIEVFVCPDQSDFVSLNRRWMESIRLKRPFVAIKSAISIDGFISKNENERYQLTSSKALDYSQELRCNFDAILVGTNTVEADDPLLTIRKFENQEFKQPLRVIMGNRELSQNHRVFNSDAESIQIKTHNPNEVLTQVIKLNVNSILIEGGASVASAFLSDGLVDEMHIFMANKILGQGVNMFEQFKESVPHLEISFKNVLSLEPDVLIQANVYGR